MANHARGGDNVVIRGRFPLSDHVRAAAKAVADRPVTIDDNSCITFTEGALMLKRLGEDVLSAAAALFVRTHDLIPPIPQPDPKHLIDYRFHY